MIVNTRTKETEKTQYIIKKMELLDKNFYITNMSTYIKICPSINTAW